MTRRQLIDDLTTIAVPEQPALSPDGSQVVYVLRTTDADADRTVREIWGVGARDGRPRRLTRGPADTAPAWSPDGTHVAFLRTAHGAPQVWLLDVRGGEPEPLTTLPMGAGAPVWSPDGTRIAFAAAVDLAADAGESDEARARRDTAPVVADRLDLQADGAGLLRSVRTHLHVLDLDTRRCRRVTDGDWHAGRPSWSPDSTRLAFSAATARDADLVLRVPVHVLDVTAVATTPEPVGLTEGVGGPVGWTADGSALLVVGTTGAPTGHNRLLRLPLDGGDPVDLTAPLDRNVMPGGPAYPGALPQLVDEGATVLFCARERGCTHLYSVPVDGGTPRPVLGGAGRNVQGLSVAGGVAVVALGTPTSFGEIVAVDLATGAETVRTDHGADLADVELFAREEREFTISDGTVVQGWLIRDPAAEPGPQPLLLDVHGGPHNAWNAAADEVHLYHQELVARGWTVLLLNPRGSDGYGEQFFDAVRGGWGEADAKDFLEPLDDLVADGTADPRRLAVAGYSYGGFMTCYLTSRDDRFAAAVAGGVVTDLTSMAGTSDEGHFLSEYELGARPWGEGSERYAAMSPLTHIDRVRTPTLIVHGGADLLCPVGQAQQWHTALREQGVPTRLVLYPEGSHIFILDGRPSHRTDFNRRVLDWVEQYAGDATGPRRPRIDAAHWQRRLTALAARYGVPGATLGILRLHPGGDDELVEAAHGVLNVDTGVGTTPDSVFQIGSITKVWTTTIVMQLVDEGLLDLDAPIVEVLPELRLADPDATKGVTMRHLLTHTSGIDGDVFTDTGRGDDNLEKYVAQLVDVAQSHPLGATWSYCNSGFSLAGRVIEKIIGGTWDEAVRKRIFEPLGLRRTSTLPEEALLHRAAVGHIGEPGTDPVRAPVWTLQRSAGPAGLINSTVADLLGFARLHLTGGLAPDGTRLLSEEAAAEMASKQADLPDKHTLGDSWGLGWIRNDWGGHRVIGHGGNTVGQAAFLELLPSHGFAVALLTNGGNNRDLHEDLYREIFAELVDVELPRLPTPPAEPVSVDVSRHVGTYERAGVRVEVAEGPDGPVMRTTVIGPLAELVPEETQEYALVPVEENLFLVQLPGSVQSWFPVTFYELPTGQRYVHFGARATPRVS
ncbi:serine hydrolase [Pseudonocardia xinjiangensis]|uniref:serine hydrolase n=1 Tax=Pseudonocardia xinjiangensis TaxID=75289 RepID=UPI003D8DBB84